MKRKTVWFFAVWSYFAMAAFGGPLSREKILIDFNGATVGSEPPLSSGANSQTRDSVLPDLAPAVVFNLPDESEVQPRDFQGAYSSERGFGFLNGIKLEHRNRIKCSSPLLADMVLVRSPSIAADFQLDVPPGKYEVTTFHHDARFPSVGGLQISISGTLVAEVGEASVGPNPRTEDVKTAKFKATVISGQPLIISFQTTPSEDGKLPSFPINGLYIVPIP